MSIIVVAEHDNNALKTSTLNTVTAALQLGGDVSLLVAGSNSGAAATAAASIAGVAKALHADAPHYEHALAEELAPLVVACGAGTSHILAPANTFGKNLLPRVAALLDVDMVSDIIKVESADTFVRPIYAGNAMARVRSKDKIKIISVRSTNFAAAATTGGAAVVEAIDATPPVGLSAFLSQEGAETERPELSSARVVISGGRGFGSGDNFKMLEDIADKLGAAIGPHGPPLTLAMC